MKASHKPTFSLVPLTTSSTLIEMVKKVNQIDFRSIGCKLFSEGVVDPSRIVVSIQNYKKFLAIGVAFKASIVPNLEEDNVWHTLQLDTDLYQLVSWYLERSAAIRHFGYVGIRGGNDPQLLAHKYDRGRELINEYFATDLLFPPPNCYGNCKVGGSGCDVHIRDGILPIRLPELETEKFLKIQGLLMGHRPPEAGFLKEIPFNIDDVNSPIAILLK